MKPMKIQSRKEKKFLKYIQKKKAEEEDDDEEEEEAETEEKQPTKLNEAERKTKKKHEYWK